MYSGPPSVVSAPRCTQEALTGVTVTLGWPVLLAPSERVSQLSAESCHRSYTKTRMMWVASHAACGLLLPFPMLFKMVTKRKTEKNKSLSRFFEQEKLNVKPH